MKEKFNFPLIASIAMLCSATSGCGDDSEKNSSSTNDTEQREAAQYNSSVQYNTEHSDDSGDSVSKKKFKSPMYNGHSNNRPIADISSTHTFFSGETVTLDGSGSHDEEGEELKYFWRQAKGPKILLDDCFSDTLTFVAPDVTEPTQFVFNLIVYDGMYADLTGFSLQVSPLADNTPPTITQRYPEAGQNGVPTKTEVSTTFNEALSEATVDETSLTLTQSGTLVPGHVSYDDVSHSIVFTPINELDESAQYTVTLSEGIQDVAGNPVPSESWEFLTAGGDDKPDDGDENSDDGADDEPGDSTDDTPDNGDDQNPGDNASYNLGPTTQQIIDECMDEADKQMLTLVNNARAQSRSCGTESYQTAPALAWNCRLESAAYGHSVSMAENNYFSHTGQDGSSPGDRITAAGYDWRTYGENIAAGYRDAETVMEGWLTSPGHCANLMNASFEDIGVAVVNGSGSYGIYWTQDFAAQ
jgi:uncharacterized protein YkwD